MLKGIIYDMDGVLINTEPLHFQIWKQTFALHGLEIEYDKYKGCIGSTADFLFDIIEREYGKDFHGDVSLVKDHHRIKDEIIQKEGVPQVDGTVDMLHRVHDAGYQMAVASSSPQRYINLEMDELGVTALFDTLCSGEGVAHPKPAPDVFLKAARLLELQPEECLVVEDSTNGCRAAKAAGMTVIGYHNPDSGNQNLEIADAIIENHKELTREFLDQIHEKARKAKQVNDL